MFDAGAPVAAASTRAMRVLVWHWGRRGAGPLFAVRLAEAIGGVPGCVAQLSLAAGAEVFEQSEAPVCDWREATYRSRLGYILQRVATPFLRRRTVRRLRALAPDVAVCVMPALLDLRMTGALRRLNIPYAVIVHDDAAHAGEALRFRAVDQPRLLRPAAMLFALTGHVASGLRRQGFGQAFGAGHEIVTLWHPALQFGEAAPAVLSHGGLPRLLFFGRLLPYKGLDLLADALELLGPDLPFDVRICGEGADSAELSRLRAMRNVTVEQGWVAEAALPALVAWADVVVLPYREASQSGVAAAALGHGRFVVATSVGGLPEQLAGAPRASLCAPTGVAIAQALRQVAYATPAGPAVDAAADWRALAARMVQTLRKLPVQAAI